MSVLEMVRQWGGMAGLIGLVWLCVEAIRHRSKALRLDRETYEKRPLVPDEKLAVLRPGDTVLMMPPLDDLTKDQQEVLVGSMKAMIEPAKERGIEFIVIPDWGQKAIVVSRGALPERADDQAAMTELNPHAEDRIASARQRRERLLSLHQVVLGKVQVLLCSKAGGIDDQGLIADLDGIEVLIRETFGEPCSLTGS